MTGDSRLPARLLPDTAAVGDDGWLRIGGCSVRDLAVEFGTPLFVYDEQHVRARCREAVAAFGPGRAIYATKAFLCRAMARLAYDEGMRLDVATEGELHIVLAAGVPASACVMHGNNKSVAELQRAITEAWGRSWSTRSTRWIASTRSLPTAQVNLPTCCSGSRPASTPTRTSTSPPDRTTRSSVSTSPTATPSGRCSGPRGRRACSSSDCTATSARMCSRRRASPERLR